MDFSQAMFALQSTLMEFQRQNEEAQRRAQESQTAMFNILNAIVQQQGSGKDAPFDSGASSSSSSSSPFLQRADQLLQDRDAFGRSAASAPSLHSQLPQLQSTLANANTEPQKQLLQLLQALQAQTESPSGNASATTMLATANDIAKALNQNMAQAASQRSHTSNENVPAQEKRQKYTGQSSPAPMSKSRSAKPTSRRQLHKSGIQSSPLLKPVERLAVGRTLDNLSSSQSSTNRQHSSQITEGQSPILGGLTPGYEADYLSGPSPTYSSGGAAASVASLRDLIEGAKVDNKYEGKEKARCYNCGIYDEPSWRYMKLEDESHARHFEESVCVVDGSRHFRACNPCGMYFLRTKGVSRPQYVWRKSMTRQQARNARLSKERKRGEQDATGEQFAHDTDKSTLEQLKRSSFARTLSEACEIDSKRIAPNSNAKHANAIGAQQASSSSSRRPESGLQNETSRQGGGGADGVTSQDVGQQTDIDDLVSDIHDNDDVSADNQSQRSRQRRKMLDFENARLHDYVMDVDGKWRTKRSMLENPVRRSVGRPGGVKTGKGEGRTRSKISKKAERLELAKIEMAKGRELYLARIKDAAERMRIEKALAEANRKPGSKRASEKSSSDSSALLTALQSILSASNTSAPSSIQDATQSGRSDFGPLPAQQDAVHATPRQPQGHPTKTPLTISRARYGAPAHLLNSSPATAFQTVMDEADTDWKALFGLEGPMSAPRRSPRKKPTGTHANVNPYATSCVSPSMQRAPQLGTVKNLSFNGMNQADLSALMQMVSSSPLANGQLRSGQSGWAWTSSDDVADGDGIGRKNVSSAITSPTSPSPIRSRRKNSQGKRKADSMLLEAGPAESSMTSGGEREKTRSQHTTSLSSLNAGPFMGLDSSDGVQGEDGDEDEGPGSPTLGRSIRLDKKKTKRGESNMAMDASSSDVHFSSTPVEVVDDAHEGVNGTSSIDSHGNGDWARAGTMPELFPAMSPDKKWNVASPSQALWNSPTSWALRMPTPSPFKGLTGKDSAAASSLTQKEKEDGPNATKAQLDVRGDTKASTKSSPKPSSSNAPTPHGQRKRRKPLPATVEDATPSDQSGSPSYDDDEVDADEEESEGDEAGDSMVFDLQNGANLAELMSMFDDPYGLLAASGINFAQPNGDKAEVAPVAHQDQNEAPPSEQPKAPAAIGNAIDMDLSHIELFKTFDFDQQLGAFNETGASGVTASASDKVATKVEAKAPLRTSPRKQNAMPS